MRIPWTAKRSKQSILKKVNPEYSLEELMLKLKLQYFGHLVPRADSLGELMVKLQYFGEFQRVSSLEKTLILGNIENRRRRG